MRLVSLLFAGLLASVFLAACQTDPVDGTEEVPEPATSIVLQLKLSNSDSISVDNVVFRLNSNLGDTLVDTLSVLDIPPNYVTRNFAIQSLRWWNLEIEARDSTGIRLGWATAGPFASKGGGKIVEIEVPMYLHLSSDSLFL